MYRCVFMFFFFFKQKTAYEMRISDWSSDVCSSDLGWAAGGYLGVEVFFVVSGFLITSLLLTEHRERGDVDLIAFWRRRARRLLPAGFVFVCRVVASAAVVLPPGDLRRSCGAAIYSVLDR